MSFIALFHNHIIIEEHKAANVFVIVFEKSGYIVYLAFSINAYEGTPSKSLQIQLIFNLCLAFIGMTVQYIPHSLLKGIH